MFHSVVATYVGECCVEVTRDVDHDGTRHSGVDGADEPNVLEKFGIEVARQCESSLRMQIMDSNKVCKVLRAERRVVDERIFSHVPAQSTQLILDMLHRVRVSKQLHKEYLI